MSSMIEDPFVATVVLGIIWPLIQAALDRPWWTRGRRVALVIVAAVVFAVLLLGAGVAYTVLAPAADHPPIAVTATAAVP